MKTIRVRNLGTVVTGHTPPTSDKEYYGGDILFIKPTDMVAGQRYTFKTEELFSEKAYKKYKSSLLPKGSTCVVCIGTLGDKLTITHSEAFTNQSVNSIIPNKSFDNDYVYYLMKYNLPKVKNLNSGTASGREFVSKTIFEKLSIDVHEDITTQKKIASILSAYDSQIENNQKRIKLLEQMAENLYKEWFVRFRFPGYETAEFEGGIPKGWERRNLTDFLVFQKGVEPGSDAYSEDRTLTPFFRVGDIEDKEATYFVDITSLSKYQLVQPMDVLCSFDGTVGRVAIGLEGMYSSGLCRIAPKDKQVTPAYVYFLMRSQPIQNTIQTFANGSTILHAGKSIKKLQTYFDPSIVQEFGEEATPLLNEILSLEKSNKILTTQRDLLLPRLMSGKLSI